MLPYRVINQTMQLPVTINITQKDCELLKTWASTSRTITLAIHLINEYARTDISDKDEDAIDLCLNELTELMPTIHNVTKSIQQELWNQD